MDNDRKDFAGYMINVIRSGVIPYQASSLAYSFILSFIPLVMILISFLGEFALPDDEVYAALKFMLPHDAYVIISGIIDEIITSKPIGTISIIPFIYFTSHATKGIIRITDSVYTEHSRRGGLRLFIISVMYAVLMILSLMVLLAVVVFGDIILKYLEEYFLLPMKGVSVTVVNIIRFVGAFMILWLFLSLVYASSPNSRLKFRDVYKGAFFSSVGWIIVSVIFAFYVNNFSSYGLLFGSLGGVFVLLVWLYISSYIMILGVYVNRGMMK